MLFVPNYICRQEITEESERELGKQEQCLSWARPHRREETGQATGTLSVCVISES